MTESTLPAWVEKAIAVMDAPLERERLKKRWGEIKMDVLPALATLSNVGKQLVLEQALWASIYGTESACEGMREAYSEMKDLNRKIVDHAAKLVDLLRRQDELAEAFGFLPDAPYLWRTLEKAVARYPHWHFVARAQLNDFLRIATGQSRPGPVWSDLLEEFAAASGDDIEGEQIEIISSRKRGADFLRALLRQLRYLEYDGEHIPANFRLTDQAIATLANVLGGLDPPATADGVKVLRHRIKKKSNG